MNAIIESTYLVPHFDETYRFIKEAKDANGCVLVHCKMGMSRSASSVIAYIMKEYKMNLCEAMEKVRKARPIVQPNDSFARQLVEYNGILNAKVDFFESHVSSEDDTNSCVMERKMSAGYRCKDVDVKSIVGTRFSSVDCRDVEERPGKITGRQQVQSEIPKTSKF